MNSRYKHDMRLSTLMRFLSFGTELLLPGSNIHNHKFVSSFSRQHGHSSDWEKYLNTKRRGLEYIKKGMCVMILIYHLHGSLKHVHWFSLYVTQHRARCGLVTYNTCRRKMSFTFFHLIW